jgi:replication factor A1
MSFSEASLTKGAISTLVNMQSAGADRNFQPDIQILSLKNVGPGKSNEGQDRWRVVLSDGVHFVQGMLATQLSAMVESGELQQFSMIRIQDFMNNKIQDRNIIIILRIEVLGSSDRKLGVPTDFQKAGAAAAAPPAASAAAPMYNRTNTAHTPAAKGSPAKSNPYSSPSNPYSPQKNRSSGGRAPIVAQGVSPGGTPITLISQLNMYQNRWTLKARVVSKSDIRTWSNAKGEGSLFSVDFLDSSDMDIRATMFKESVDKYYNFLEVGKVYTISGGKIKVANMKFNTCKSQYEMTLDNNAQVALADDAGEIKTQSFDFTKISDLEQVEAGKNVDVIGVVQEISDVQSIMSKKNGQELHKTDVTLIDDTGVQVRLTLWGESAMNAQRDIGVHKPVAFRRTRVSDYGGVSLSGSQGSFVEPAIPETEALQEWWKSQGSRGAPVKSLSSSGGQGGKMDSFTDRKTIADIKNLNLGYNEKGDYICFKANFSFFKKDKEGGAWYTACPNKEDPCRNRCKVTQTTDGNWQCDRCQGVYPNCNRKWIFSGTVADDTASTWVSLFDDQALTLFNGAMADDVFAEFENQDSYDGYFAKACHTEWNLKCRVKNEMVNDEPRLKTTIVRMEPVDYAAESRDMISQMEKWQM